MFKIIYKDPKSKARVGEIRTPHGIVKTPAFVPDATYGAVKHLSSEELKEIGVQMVLGNPYHLSIRPGMEAMKHFGGLRGFMKWDGPILTDSGGWQVFSMVHKNKMGRITENGVIFKNPFGGGESLMTSEVSIQNQLNIGSDILMTLDWPVEPDTVENVSRYSVSLTTKWAKRCYDYFCAQPKHEDKISMAIIQGGNYLELRKRSFEELEAICHFPGYGFGGILSDPEIMDTIGYVSNLIPDDRIRYVMGGGTPNQIIEAVKMGYDLFDCVIPTRHARHGLAYTFSGEVRILNEKYKMDTKPIEDDCLCFACQNYSRGYIRHLMKAEEPLGQRLMTIHNLFFYNGLMKKIRTSIEKEGDINGILC